MLPVFFRPFVTVVDCGVTAVSIATFVRDGERLCCTSVAMEALSETASDEAWLVAVRAALARLAGKRGRFRSPVTLVLPAQGVWLKQFNLPKVAAAKRARILRFEVEQSLPFPAEEMIWASVLLAGSGASREVLVAAARQTWVKELLATIESLEVEVAVVLPAPLATLALAKEEGVTIQVGERTVGLAMREGQRVALRTVMIPSEEPGQARGERLSEEVARAVATIQRQGGFSAPKRGWLMGDSGCEPVLRARLGIALEEVAASDLVGGISELDPKPRTESIGAAEIALRRRSLRLDLMPPEMAAVRRWRQRRWGLAVAAVLALIGPVATGWREYRRGEELRATAAQTELELAAWRRHEAANQAKIEERDRVQVELAQWQLRNERRRLWVRLLGEWEANFTGIGGVWIETLKVESAGEASGLRLALSGRLLDRTGDRSALAQRARQVRRALAEAAGVTAVENERFGSGGAGVLQFSAVVVLDSRWSFSP